MCIADGVDRNTCFLFFFCFQKIDVRAVFLDELHAAVDQDLKRFLKSCVFYFIRCTKGEMTFQCQYNKAQIECFLPMRSNHEIFTILIETIVDPLDMDEASVLMPRLFHFGMYYGHPLLVLKEKLTHVSKMQNNLQMTATTNRQKLMRQHLVKCQNKPCILRFQILN